MIEKTTQPKVSILCITYNQEKFIKETLDSFLMQKTKFPIEIIVHDDASTDSTPEIIRQYDRDNPGLFRLWLETTNQVSQGKDKFVEDMFKMAKGEYIALCEGDDYWTDPEKLQLQVDFLDEKPTFALCFHRVRGFFENREEPDYLFPKIIPGFKYTLKELLKENYIQTNSVMYRRVKYGKMPSNIMPRDWYTHLYHAQYGKIGFIDRVMSVYRRHPKGLWWDSYKQIDKIWDKYGVAHLNLYVEVLKLYGSNPEYEKIIYDNIYRMLNILIDYSSKNMTDQLEKSLSTLPTKISSYFIINQERYIKDLTEDVSNKEKKIENLNLKIDSKNAIISQNKDELRLMKSSKFWKLRNIVAKLVGKDIV